MTTEMQFIKRVKRLRDLQSKYFKTRNQELLARCKQGEYIVRLHCQELAQKQSTLIVARLVLSMLDAQKFYYQERSTASLRAAKVAESAVDKALADFEKRIEKLEAWGREAVRHD